MEKDLTFGAFAAALTSTRRGAWRATWTRRADPALTGARMPTAVRAITCHDIFLQRPMIRGPATMKSGCQCVTLLKRWALLLAGHLRQSSASRRPPSPHVPQVAPLVPELLELCLSLLCRALGGRHAQIDQRPVHVLGHGLGVPTHVHVSPARLRGSTTASECRRGIL